MRSEIVATVEVAGDNSHEVKAAAVDEFANSGPCVAELALVKEFVAYCVA